MPAYTPITASLHDFGGQGLMGARLIIEPKGWDTPDADGTAQIYLPDVRTVVFVDDMPQTFQLEDCAVRRKEVGFNVTARFFDLSKGIERSVSLGLIVPQGAEEVALRTLLGAEDHPPSTQIDALAAALGGGQESRDRPSGPPLTSGEKDALRVAVQQCWNVGSLSSDALRTTVVVAVSMGEDGKPNNGSIRMLSASGGGDSAAKQAFEAARRAIIRCGSRGFNLPVEKYDSWRDIEMTFNPEKMRIK